MAAEHSSLSAAISLQLEILSLKELTQENLNEIEVLEFKDNINWFETRLSENQFKNFVSQITTKEELYQMLLHLQRNTNFNYNSDNYGPFSKFFKKSKKSKETLSSIRNETNIPLTNVSYGAPANFMKGGSTEIKTYINTNIDIDTNANANTNTNTNIDIDINTNYGPSSHQALITIPSNLNDIVPITNTEKNDKLLNSDKSSNSNKSNSTTSEYGVPSDFENSNLKIDSNSNSNLDNNLDDVNNTVEYGISPMSNKKTDKISLLNLLPNKRK
eukprot:TRINITY_DN1499_c0_g1_i1.p1 TRINITY_DN1499_c0_g1~~TRINITY_DN1499_c0_g1_i1.p1  ORF type:complete len:286 (+),score=90.43 TRINITY_DN1499_c0_g1_i1:41-859(+)